MPSPARLYGGEAAAAGTGPSSGAVRGRVATWAITDFGLQPTRSTVLAVINNGPD